METLARWFKPTIDALCSSLPFTYRWRLLFLQPVVLLASAWSFLPWIRSTRFTVLYIPVRDGRIIRALLFQPSLISDGDKLRPLHLDIHGGGFLGGLPEADARFCSNLSDETGAVVVSATYRFAPRHPFPAAIDDIDDVVAWLMENSQSQCDADPRLFTIGGSSAGGNLALAACQQPRCQTSSPTSIKGVVTFYCPVDLRIPPGQKKLPPSFPKWDPLWWLQPMFDSYAGLSRPMSNDDPRCHPVLADRQMFPDDMLFIIPTIDFLLYDQLKFVKRLQHDNGQMDSEGKSRNVKATLFEGCIHGWLELPSFAIRESTRTDAFSKCCEFISEVHRKHGYVS